MFARVLNSTSRLSLRHIVRSTVMPIRPISTSSTWLRQSEKQKLNRKWTESRSRDMTYEELGEMRRGQASRSVLIQVPGRRSCDFVYRYCRQYGNVSNIFYDSRGRDYVLVEFDSEESALGMASSADHFETENVPVDSRVLYLTNAADTKEGSSSVHVVTDGPRETNLSDLYNASNMREQMLMYYHTERLTELETRFRYFVCSMIEDVLTPLFPLIEILPYGSSANKLGRHGSDLDMVLILNSEAHKMSSNSPFRYMTKVVDNERLFTQRTLRVIADILHLFVPHITQVQKIVHARVPIINFYHEATAIACDISVNNDAVVTMSKLLYFIGEKEARFRPILFALRRWASINDLTLDRPGPRFSNFMLTMMLLSFLQMRTPGLVPPLSSLLTAEGICKANMHLPDSNCALESDDLLIDFFNFYADFDFNNRGLSLLEGGVVDKPASSTLFIENPLDTGHNCAQNVHQKELEYLRVCLRSARDRLVTHRTKSDNTWGLLNLIESRNFGSDLNVGVNVRNLFTT